MRLVPSLNKRRRILALAAGVTVLSGFAVATALPASAAVACRAQYSVVNQWPGGFQGALRLTNLGDAWTSWTVTFTWPSGQRVTSGWGGIWTVNSNPATARNETWNANIGLNGVAELGFLASWTGTNTAPTSFTVNGVVCTGTGPTTNPTTTNPTTNPTSNPTVTTQPPTSNPTTTTSPPCTTNCPVKVDNPYAGARGYVNPQWRTRAMGEPGGSRVANQPTGVWLDRISAIAGNSSPTTGSMGLRQHLNEAVNQMNSGSGPLYIQIVIYNLPGRDCSALASNGELGVNDLPRYKAEYIDPIASIMAEPAFRNLRIIAVIEIDSLPNLITNLNVAKCATMQQNGGYTQGIAYALQKLGALPNVYNYIDAAHHGWIGWDSNFGPTANLMAQTADLSGTKNNVHGFITNTANYSALVEPYINVNGTVGGQQIRQSRWVDWNPYIDESSFATAFRQRLISSGFPSNIGMLIDTSRNGWGGPNRPTGPSPSTDLNTFVDQSRIDRRIHAGNWCNQSGAGLGERPRANPAPGVDAYVWIKPPGESDGSSSLIPNDEGKGFDRMCDPTYTGNERNGNNMTGALPNAPLSGHWFSAQFQQLMANAYPPL